MDQSPLAAKARMFLDSSLQNSTSIQAFFMLVSDHIRTDGLVFRTYTSQRCVSSALRRMPVMEIFLELASKDWTVLVVCLGLVPMTTHLLKVPQVSAVMVGTPAARARL